MSVADTLMVVMTFFMDLAEDVKKVASMRSGGGSAQARIDAIISALENYLFVHPQTEAFVPLSRWEVHPWPRRTYPFGLG